MGKRKRSKRSRARARSTSTSSSSSSRTRTPSPPPRHKKKKAKVSRKADTSTVSTGNASTVLNNIIPDFDPLRDDIGAWLNIIQSYAKTFAWSDDVVRYQALNKLKGSAKTWYDSLLRTENQWPSWRWADWRRRLASSFQIRRDMFQLLREVVDRKPTDNQSLYEFYFEQKSKIDRLSLNFTEMDIISIIIGNIGDSGIGASIEASNFTTCDSLASFLHGRVYKSRHSKQLSLNIRDGQSKPIGHVTTTQPSTFAKTAITAGSSRQIVSSNNSQVINQPQRKPLECYVCGGNHKKINCEKLNRNCEFCGKRGHEESMCFHKKNSMKPEKQDKQHETKFVSTLDPRNKFIKRVCVNDFFCDAFIDTGSSCSLISQSIADKHSLKRIPLPSPVLLQGFTKESSKYVNHKVTLDFKLDSVCLKNVDFYVINDLADCEMLIGRNVTERSDLIYSRVGDRLQFDYAKTYNEFCNNIAEFELDADSHQSELTALFRTYRDCVASNTKELGKVVNHEMTIEVTNPQPIQCRPFRSSHTDRKIIREMVNELLENNIICESNSPYASPALLVGKKNGEKRLCIDYRMLNKVTVKNKYPMPRIEDLVDRLQGHKCFTSLDLKSGYYQIPMHQDSVDKVAFITEDGHYSFLRVPFGLVNAPSVFQQMMNKVLGNLRFENVILYLDDVYLVTETVEENLELLERVLKIFRDNGLTLNLKKCHFFKSEIEFLGYKIKPNCVMPNEPKLEAVAKFPVPKTVHQLRQFLGLISYFRKFIKNCAMISAPLTRLLKKDAIWVWDTIHEQAFQTLKHKLTSDSVLTIFDPNKENVLYTDASREGLAGILMQVTEEGEKPVHYYSRQTTDDEKKYHSFELELLAIVCSLQKFRLYLLGSLFKIITDCTAVRYALTKKEIIPRIARWVLSTQEFAFEITHREGTRMQHVDALSRNPVPSGEKSETEIVLSITEADWLLSVQLQDPELSRIRTIIESGDADNNKDVFTNYEVLGGKVYRRTSQGRRWVVPKNCIWQIIKCNHDDLGHFSVDKTVERIGSQYWFRRMRHVIKKYIKNCINCIYYKRKGGAKEGELYPLPKYARPYHTLHLDHLGPFVKTKNKNQYLLVVVDAFTKFVFIFPVRSTKTSCVIKELENLSKTFGNPKRIITDAGSSFTSNEFTQYCSNKNIHLHTVATGMHRSNGQAERFNKTILDALKTLGANSTEDRWDQYVKLLQQGMNSTIHKTIKAVPSEVFLGYRIRTDSDSLAPESEDSLIDVTKLRETADSNIKSNARYQKGRFDRSRSKARSYDVGDLVMITIQSHSNDGKSRKLLPVFKGPFQVSKVMGNDRYEVTEVKGSERSNKKYTGVTAAENMKYWINIDDWNIN
jgi:hypothetical protein